VTNTRARSAGTRGRYSRARTAQPADLWKEHIGV
jgi:hypothetical protein